MTSVRWREGMGVGAVLAAAVAATVAGWWGLWFLTDDAFIAFRYVSNARLGLGWVWNPPPFLPVEGYTSFLWLWLLRGAWALGLAPPRAANLLSLAASLGSLGLCAAWIAARHRRLRPPIGLALALALPLGLLVTNASFLTWSSSGLETALFDLLLLAWVLALLALPGRRAWLAVAAGAASLLALCRPDGLLFAAATLAAPLVGRRPRDLRGLGSDLVRLIPLLVIPAHLLWRHGFYGAWLPNTWQAKVVEPWPAAGLRYIAAFALEYGLWLWLPLLLLPRLGRRARAGRGGAALPGAGAAALLALGTVGLHLGYYTIMVGGDHFEYRILTPLVPLLALGFAETLFSARWRWRWPAALGAFLALAAAQSVLPWSALWWSRDLGDRSETHLLTLALAPRLPGFLAPLTRPWDALQRWMVPHYVGTRRQEHAAFWRFQEATLPSREEGAQAFAGVQNPVIVSPTVGVLGWVYPHAAVIDLLGLNDWVVARTPIRRDRERVLAHDRWPPEGYIAELKPVLWAREGRSTPQERESPLTDEEVRRVEQHWRAWVEAEGGS